jgi:aminopeptidase-like protein
MKLPLVNLNPSAAPRRTGRNEPSSCVRVVALVWVSRTKQAIVEHGSGLIRERTQQVLVVNVYRVLRQHNQIDDRLAGLAVQALVGPQLLGRKTKKRSRVIAMPRPIRRLVQRTQTISEIG